jgi:ABC-2 type transport system ATP-binding protein
MDELVMQGRFYGMNSSDSLSRAKELTKSLDLTSLEKRRVSTLSGGQRRRLDIALGLMHSPGLIFLDEPSTGMDPHNRANLWEHIERLRERQETTIVLTTHYLEEADRLAQRVAIVSRGRIVVEGEPEELKRGLQGESVSVELQDVDGRLADAERVVAEISDNVHVEGNLVRARVPNGAQAIPVILGALDDAGIDVAAVTTARPSLDDVYLHYTGRDFAREDEEGR